jgi:CrcB protein
MGLLTVVLVERPVSEALRQGLLTGLLGGFTTYSAFNQDTFALLHRGSVGLAALQVATTVLLCLGLGGLGHLAGRWLVA